MKHRSSRTGEARRPLNMRNTSRVPATPALPAAGSRCDTDCTSEGVSSKGELLRVQAVPYE